MTEEEVYELAKFTLQARGWLLLGGQPPRGSDSIPVIEVKSGSTTEKGSFAAYKPDLVAFRLGFVLLVECKPQHSDADVRKLRDILSDPKRLDMLYAELDQRGLALRYDLRAHDFHACVRGAIAHGGMPSALPDLVVINVSQNLTTGVVITPQMMDALFLDSWA